MQVHMYAFHLKITLVFTSSDISLSLFNHSTSAANHQVIYSTFASLSRTLAASQVHKLLYSF